MKRRTRALFFAALVVLAAVGAGCASPGSGVIVNATTEDPYLATLDLHGQGLETVPAYVFEWTDLVTLDVSHNKLTGALPSQLGNLMALRNLDASNNSLTGVPAEIGRLTQLETLDLSNNRLTGLPNELGNLKNLKVLDLRGNPSYSKDDLAGIRARLRADVRILTDDGQ